MKLKSDLLIPVAIFLSLAIIVGLGVISWHRYENQRPVPVEVRIVSATDGDPIYREGARFLKAGEKLHLALVLRLEYPGSGDRWVAPVSEVELDGKRVDVLRSDSWPEDDRFLRAFWFTLESPYLGGRLASAEDASEKLVLKPFFAPEMGQGLLAAREPEWHAEDQVDLGENLAPENAGTTRLYARVHVLPKPGSTHPIFAVSSLGPEDRADPRLMLISRELPSEGIPLPISGRLFRLPGFEIVKGSGLDPASWTDGLEAVSSETFAAMAAYGSSTMPVGAPETPLRQSGGKWLSGSRVLSWGPDVAGGDLLRQGAHWMVLVRDDGNGILDTGDVVAQSWKRPPAILHMESVFDPGEGALFLVRRLPIE